ALCALAAGIAVERVGKRDGCHLDALEGLARHLLELAIEGLVADEETRMRDDRAAVDRGNAAAQDARAHQGQKPVDQHLSTAVETDGEGGQFTIDRQRLPN